MAKTTKTVAHPVFDEDAQDTVERAIHALYAIRRLAMRAIGDLSADCGDAEVFCNAIKGMTQLHGKALDDCMTRVTRTPGVGCFDKEANYD